MARLRQIEGGDGQGPMPDDDVFSSQLKPDSNMPIQQPTFQDPDYAPPGGGENPGGPETGNSTPPREGGQAARRPLTEGNATAPQPSVPTPHNGAVSPGPQPYPPMPGIDPSSLASPQRRSLFGGAGGLTEGGLGVPGNSASQGSNPISALIQQLLMNRGS